MRPICLTCLCVLLIAALAACAPSTSSDVAQPGPRLPRLPAPSGLPRAGAFVDADRFRNGSQFEAALANALVTAEGDALRFSPDWDLGAGQNGLAYCVYRWTLDGYAGPASLALSWTASPAAGTLWVARANWGSDRWDWTAVPGAGSAVSLAPLGDYLRADGSIAVAVAVAAPAAQADALLARAFIGQDNSVVPGDIQFEIDNQAAGTPISELVYGVNEIAPAEQALARPSLVRFGGNRWTAYNWENNASNAGTDWFNQNDSYMSDSTVPGEGVRARVQPVYVGGAQATLVTVPLQGYCAADTLGGGDVNQTPNYLDVRFRQNLPVKGAAFSNPPDTADGFVYQDEFLNWLDSAFPGKLDSATPGMYLSLDNEPDLWEETHPRIQQVPLTYDALIARHIDFVLGLRAVVPEAQFFGPANYGFAGYANLQDAPDAGAKGFFLDYYLAQMAQAEADNGQRLLNFLDVHWYPEARGGGNRITTHGTSAAEVAARLQAPRSLWDPAYEEDSWIVTDYYQDPIRLLPRLREKIAANYPGTGLAITEYNYGAGQHISGGLAQADVLGVFGREGLTAACFWPLNEDNAYFYAAFALFRNYDGAGARFGANALDVAWNDYAGYSAYAAKDGAKLTVLLINKQDAARTARLDLAGAGYAAAEVYTLTAAGGPQPVRQADLDLPAGSSFNAPLPALSATLLVLE